MAEITKLFKEIYYEIFKVVFLNSLLDTLIFFFLVHIIFSLFRISVYYSIIMGLVFLTLSIVYRMKKAKLKNIEERNPSVKEILRTVRDNYGKETFMVKACFEDLINRMKQVSSGNMIIPSVFITKSVIIALLCLSAVILSPHSFNLSELKEKIPLTFDRSKSISANEIYGIEFNESDKIYGEQRVAVLGNQEVELSINPELSEINLNDVQPIEEKTFQAGGFPETAEAVAEELSQEKIPKESKIAIAYNLKIKQT